MAAAEHDVGGHRPRRRSGGAARRPPSPVLPPAHGVGHARPPIRSRKVSAKLRSHRRPCILVGYGIDSLVSICYCLNHTILRSFILNINSFNKYQG